MAHSETIMTPDRTARIHALLLAAALAGGTHAGADTSAPTLAAVSPRGTFPVFDAAVNHFPVLAMAASDAGGSGLHYIECTFSLINAAGEFQGDGEIVTRVLAGNTLADGNAASGNHLVECRVPRGTAAGQYRLRAIKLADAAGNIRDYTADGSGASIPAASPITFQVTGSGPAPLPTSGDTARPELIHAAIQPTALGVASSSGFFHLSLVVSDDVSGIGVAEATLVSPDGIHMTLSAVGPEAVVAGSEKSGTLQIRGRMPAGATAGPWKLARVALRDQTNKTRFFGWEKRSPLEPAVLLVYTTDADGDGRLEDDFFPDDPDEWSDIDGDGLGDNADPDDDNDGMPDVWEIQYGLDPLDPDDAGSDADGDGLSNLTEFLYGTAPDKTDSDNDGIPDNEEGPLHRTDPGRGDSDNDGYLDGTEIALGLSARDHRSRPEFRAHGRHAGSAYGLRFVSRLGTRYRIEFSNNLVDWQTVQDNVNGDGRPLERMLPMFDPANGFYRVVELP